MPRSHLPWFKFDCDEWLDNPAIRGLTLARRAVLVEILCVMNRSPRRGILAAEMLSGSNLAAIGRQIGCKSAALLHTILHLEKMQICTRDESGNLLYRPMINDDMERTRVRSRVEKHRSAAALCNADVTPNVTGSVTPQSKSKREETEEESIPPTPLFKGGGDGVSSEEKPSSKKPKSKPPPVTFEVAFAAFCAGAALDAPQRDDYEYPIREWFQHKQTHGRLIAAGWQALGKRVRDWGANRFREAVDYSIGNGYQGLFEGGRNGHHGNNGRGIPISEAPRLPHISEVD